MNRATVLFVAGCGHHAATPDAAPCGPTIVYLDRGGGSYDHGLIDDAAKKQSTLFDGPRTLPPWPGDDVNWRDLTGCIRDALHPFAIDVTEIDPGTAPHVEIVFTTAYWVDPAVTHIFPSTCRPGSQIELIFGNAIATPTRACEVAMAAFAEMTTLLGPSENCLDFASPAMDCGIRFFIDLEQRCVDSSLQPATCRCGGAATENTYATLSARYHACP